VYLLFSLVGVAAMTGMLPNSSSTQIQKNEAIAALDKEAADKAAEQKLQKNKPLRPVPNKKGRAGSTDARKTNAQQPRPPVRPKHATPQPRLHRLKYVVDCGHVESVRAVEIAAQPSGVGVVAGAVVGGVLGNQVGGGSGKKLATVAGAVGGGYAGNEIEKHAQTRRISSAGTHGRWQDSHLPLRQSTEHGVPAIASA
jgi:hypothetical protein